MYTRAHCSLHCAGWAHNWHLNKECRRRAGLEARTGVALRFGWVDTLHMPADGGTRLDEQGELRLERPRWQPRQLMVEFYAGSAGITRACEIGGVPCADPWDII